jgi:hypothetical protein
LRATARTCRILVDVRDDEAQQDRASVESSDALFKMLTEEKIEILQDATVIRHDKKIDVRVTPVEARMLA